MPLVACHWSRATGRVPNKHAGRATMPRRPHAARPLNTLYMTYLFFPLLDLNETLCPITVAFNEVVSIRNSVCYFFYFVLNDWNLVHEDIETAIQTTLYQQYLLQEFVVLLWFALCQQHLKAQSFILIILHKLYSGWNSFQYIVVFEKIICKKILGNAVLFHCCTFYIICNCWHQ